MLQFTEWNIDSFVFELHAFGIHDLHQIFSIFVLDGKSLYKLILIGSKYIYIHTYIGYGEIRANV